MTEALHVGTRVMLWQQAAMSAIFFKAFIDYLK